MAAAAEARSDDLGPRKTQTGAQEVTDAHLAILKLLTARLPGATICPSEAARMIAPGDDWRHAMTDVHSAVDKMVADGMVELSWKGRTLASRQGPYRVAARSRI
jgi:hypothetical protein